VDAALAIGVGDGGAPAAGGAADGAERRLVLVEQRGRVVGLLVDAVMDLVAAGDTAPATAQPAGAVRPGVVAATGTAGGEPFAQLAIDVLLEPLLA
jgi:chemotaxis signal transduction protein